MQSRRIFILNEPTAPRLNPALACEIGLNESLMLLQLEFWISISNNERDGQKWTYQSTRDIQETTFPFWSVMTINRAIKSLETKGLIITTTKYNKLKYDKTRWFALNFQELSKLDSISIKGYVTRSNQNDTGSDQFDTGSDQNDTTIPETTTEISTDDVQKPVSPPPPDPVPKPKTETSSSLSEDQIIKTLARLFSLVPKQFLKPSVRQTIEKALIIHSEDYAESAIQYTNDHSNGHSWQKYRAYLDKTINHGYADGYHSDAQHVDQGPTIDFKKMPDENLKFMANTGNVQAIEELKRRGLSGSD